MTDDQNQQQHYPEGLDDVGSTNQSNMQEGVQRETAQRSRDNAAGTAVPAHHINRNAD